MSDKELDNYIKTINPDFNSHIEKGTIEMNNEYYNLLEEKMARLINQNQELKEKYLNAVSDYETTMSEKNELKKQLEEKEKLIEQCDLSVSNMMDCYCERTDCSGRIKDSKVYDSLVQKVENQQQEFIKWLEDEIKLYNKDIQTFSKDYNVYFSLINDLKVGKTKTEEILQKYKEIIGDDK